MTEPRPACVRVESRLADGANGSNSGIKLVKLHNCICAMFGAQLNAHPRFCKSLTQAKRTQSQARHDVNTMSQPRRVHRNENVVRHSRHSVPVMMPKIPSEPRNSCLASGPAPEYGTRRVSTTPKGVTTRRACTTGTQACRVKSSSTRASQSQFHRQKRRLRRLHTNGVFFVL